MSENNIEKQEQKFFDVLKKLSEAVQGPWFKWVLVGVLAIFILALTFSMGMMVGYKKADFSYSWAENYHKNFGGPKRGFMVMKMPSIPGMKGDDFIGGFGLSGTLVKVEGNNLIVKGGENVEKTVLISDKTVIREGNQNLKISDLKPDDRIVIIGRPNDSGQTEAELIRVFNLK